MNEKEIKRVQSKLLKTKEAAEYLGISASAFRKLVQARRISFYCPNGKLHFFDTNDLDEYQRRGRVSSVSEIQTANLTTNLTF